ncbi:uncharacterized protein LOC141589731 [Silene latifolia]|uniref:uncharacterized protein LOC141589731 n=1 Tax=Silene latifolia TaxID=37657 RepID=UPI003D784526
MSENSENNSLYSPFDDPLFFSPTDQPGLVLSSFLFDGSSFLQWQREVVAALLSKNKSGFLTGECSLPEKTDKKHNQWIRCDLLVKRWILSSIIPVLRENLQFAISSKALWTDIVEQYGQPNILEVYELKKDLGKITQDNSSLIEYYGKLKNIWENLDHMHPLPYCTCGAMNQCSCSMFKRLVERETQAKLLQLLMGLNSGYEHAQTNLLSMEPLPPINKALGMLQKVERQKHINDTVAEVSVETAAFASKKRGFQNAAHEAGNTSKRPRDDSDPDYKVCSHCKKEGYLIEEYHRLMTCTFCKDFGYQEVSPLDPAPDTAQVAQLSQYQSYISPHVNPDFFQGIIQSVTKSVLQQVFQGISELPSADSSDLKSSIHFAGMTPTSHIVDTGASVHITSNILLLHHVKVLAKPVYVGLPDGTIKLVHKTGQVYLNEHITLHDVLLIPDFKQNLLFVARLITATGLTVSFLKNKCVFQDPTSRTVADAQRIGNLYRLRVVFRNVVKPKVSVFNKTSCPSHCNVNAVGVSDVATIHSRFGHSSLEKLQDVHGLNLKGTKNFHCEICVYAKHHVLPFPRSVSYAATCFALIHVDVWGPYKVPSISGAKSFLTILDDHSRNTWTFLIQNKTQVPGLIKGFVAYVENQFDAKIKTIRSDNGSEFCQVVEVSTSKTGKHGHAKCHFVAIDIFTGKKLEDIVPSSHNCDVPHVNCVDYQLLDITEDGFVSLLTDNGDTKDDLKLPTDDALAKTVSIEAEISALQSQGVSFCIGAAREHYFERSATGSRESNNIDQDYSPGILPRLVSKNVETELRNKVLEDKVQRMEAFLQAKFGSDFDPNCDSNQFQNRDDFNDDGGSGNSTSIPTN